MLPTAYIDGGPLENEATEFTTQEWVIVRFELNWRSCKCGGRDKRSLDLPHIRPTRHRKIEWIFYDRRKLKWICLYVRSKFTWSFKLPNMKSINWLPDFIYGPYFFETPRSLQYIFETIRLISSSISFVALACQFFVVRRLSEPFNFFGSVLLYLLAVVVFSICSRLVFAAYFPLCRWFEEN